MDIVFADDSRQRKPSRPGMGPLVAIGGIHVPGQEVRWLERSIDALCASYGFPADEEFKWSPGPELWMRSKLVEETRMKFYAAVLNLVAERGVTAIVIVEDTDLATATDATGPEADVTQLFIERAHFATRGDGIIITDRPSGDRPAEDRFLASCLDTLQSGTSYVKPDSIAFIVPAPSKFIRLLQVADVVAGCSMAYVAGQTQYAPQTFAEVKRLLRGEAGRIGGVGLKIHPDGRYANLYHWLLGDRYFMKAGKQDSLPLAGLPYATDSFVV